MGSDLFESPQFPERPDDDLDDDELAEDEIVAHDDPAEQPEADANVLPGGTARAVLEHVARSIVDDPESVSVEVERGRSGLLLSLHVGPDDMGRVIGKRGRVAQAMRTLVRAAAAREGTDATVDIVD